MFIITKAASGKKRFSESEKENIWRLFKYSIRSGDRMSIPPSFKSSKNSTLNTIAEANLSIISVESNPRTANGSQRSETEIRLTAALPLSFHTTHFLTLLTKYPKKPKWEFTTRFDYSKVQVPSLICISDGLPT